LKSKLQRFAIIAQRDNVLEPGKELYEAIKGKWNESFFKNDHPLTLELACGRGEYSVALAKHFPERNFIGVDKKGDRIWKGSTWAVEQGLANVGFLRTQMLNLNAFFQQHEADEIWITFPDPRPRKRDIKRRLTSPRFLDIYKQVVRPGGWVRLKTDNTPLFEYTLEVLHARSDVAELVSTHDLYHSPLRSECHDIQTRYEEMFTAKGEVIKYLRFCFTDL
jgi:tRNA (guanine-N7-)-methyltransferase